MCASNYECFGKEIEYIKKIINLWIEYAKFIMYENKDFIIIFYDKFYLNEKYREEISKLLNIKFDYSKINYRENYAKSSFKITETTEFDRYKHFENDELFKNIVMNNEDLKYYYKLLCNFFNYELCSKIIYYIIINYVIYNST